MRIRDEADRYLEESREKAGAYWDNVIAKATVLLSDHNALAEAVRAADPVGMELGETRLCTVTITDPGYAELEAKIAAGTATKAEQTAWDKLQKAKAPYIRAVADPANAGKVTGSGLCALGKKVTTRRAASSSGSRPRSSPGRRTPGTMWTGC